MQKLKEVHGISRGTLLLWERQGLIKPVKTPGGCRRQAKGVSGKLGIYGRKGGRKHANSSG